MRWYFALYYPYRKQNKKTHFRSFQGIFHGVGWYLGLQLQGYCERYPIAMKTAFLHYVWNIRALHKIEKTRVIKESNGKGGHVLRRYRETNFKTVIRVHFWRRSKGTPLTNDKLDVSHITATQIKTCWFTKRSNGMWL